MDHSHHSRTFYQTMLHKGFWSFVGFFFFLSFVLWLFTHKRGLNRGVTRAGLSFRRITSYAMKKTPGVRRQTKQVDQAKAMRAVWEETSATHAAGTAATSAV